MRNLFRENLLYKCHIRQYFFHLSRLKHVDCGKCLELMKEHSNLPWTSFLHISGEDNSQLISKYRNTLKTLRKELGKWKSKYPVNEMYSWGLSIITRYKEIDKTPRMLNIVYEMFFFVAELSLEMNADLNITNGLTLRSKNWKILYYT